MEIMKYIEALLSYGSVIVAAFLLLVFAVTIFVELLKNLFKKLPTNFLTVIVSIIVTVLCVCILCEILHIALVWYYIVGAVALAFFIAYAAMFGFDKFKEGWQKIKPLLFKSQ